MHEWPILVSLVRISVSGFWYSPQACFVTYIQGSTEESRGLLIFLGSKSIHCHFFEQFEFNFFIYFYFFKDF